MKRSHPTSRAPARRPPRTRAALVAASLLAAPAAQAQTLSFPPPWGEGDTPNVCVDCPWNSIPSGVPAEGVPTFPFGPPFRHWVGRFVDSTRTPHCQAVQRTLRARHVEVVPERDRIYMMLGESFFAYRRSTFYTRVANEKLAPNTKMICAINDIPRDLVLPGDVGYYYAEVPGGTWDITGVDGQQRLFDMAVDPRGYIYLAYSIYQWGVLEDRQITGKGTGLAPLYHWNPGVTAPAGVATDGPYGAATGESGGRTYLFTSANPPTNVFDVTDPAAPTFVRERSDTCISRSATFGHPLHTRFRAGGEDVIATVCGKNSLQIFPVGAFASGEPAAVTIPVPSPGVFASVTTDGTRLYAIFTAGQTSTLLVISPETPDSPASYKITATHPLGTMTSPNVITHHDGMLFVGDNQHNRRMLRVVNGMPVTIVTDGFLRNYFYAEDPAYASPQGYVLDYFGSVADTYEGKVYLIHSQMGLGEVYEIEPQLGAPTDPPGSAGATAAGSGGGAGAGGAPGAGGTAGTPQGQGGAGNAPGGYCGQDQPCAPGDKCTASGGSNPGCGTACVCGPDGRLDCQTECSAGGTGGTGGVGGAGGAGGAGGKAGGKGGAKLGDQAGPETESDDSGGCGCRSAPQGPLTAGGATFGLLALALAGRRRRR